MSFKFNPFTTKFDIVKDDGEIDHDSLINTHNLTTDIDHDALTNFVANEHIDWTNASDDFKTSGDIISSGTQDWVLKSSDTDLALGLYPNTSGNNALFRVYSKDGDGTDYVGFEIYAVGTISNPSDRERLTSRWNVSNSEFEIYSEANGTGTLRPITIYTEGNDGQLVLNTDGSVDVGGNLTVSGTGHDSFSDFVAAEHYDWTNETHNLITTGDVTTTNMTVNGIISFGAAPELTISSGVITVTASYHQVDTQSDAATDDLDTINGGVQGGIYIFRAANNSRTVVFKNNTGNIRLAGTDFSLDHSWDTIMLIYDGVNWRELSRADNNS